MSFWRVFISSCAVGLVIVSLIHQPVNCGKVPFGNVGAELGDYRLMNGDPFVTLFEHENYRGKIWKQKITKDCTNIPRTYSNWASSIHLHERCVTLCDQRDCQEPCTNIYPDKKGVKRLTEVQLNDKASSLKFCYKFGFHGK